MSSVSFAVPGRASRCRATEGLRWPWPTMATWPGAPSLPAIPEGASVKCGSGKDIYRFENGVLRLYPSPAIGGRQHHHVDPCQRRQRA